MKWFMLLLRIREVTGTMPEELVTWELFSCWRNQLNQLIQILCRYQLFSKSTNWWKELWIFNSRKTQRINWFSVCFIIYSCNLFIRSCFLSISEAVIGLLQHPRWSAFDNSYQLKAVNYYHKGLHQGCLSSPRSASDNHLIREQTLHHLAKMANEALGLKI